MNPYTFVPLAGPPDRRRPPGHERYQGHNGQLACVLTVRTPLFLYDPKLARANNPGADPAHLTADFPTDPAGRPVIWASALRGAIRGVAEAASRSCLSLFDGHYERWTVDYRSRVAPTYRACEAGGALCPACRLFGTASGGPGGFAGAVSLGDAVTEEGAAPLLDHVTVAAVQSAKPHHQAFYLDPDGGIAGRKFYYHRPDGPTTTIERSRFTRTVQPLAPGATATFALRYENLTDDDLGLLLYALVLEPGLGHKIGMGRSVGMGSMTIAVSRAVTTAPREVALGRPGQEMTGEALVTWIGERCAPFRADGEVDRSALRAVLALDPGRPIAYPSLEWFRTHPQAPLSDVPDVQPVPPAPRRVPERLPAVVRQGGAPVRPPGRDQPAARPAAQSREERRGGEERAASAPPGRVEPAVPEAPAPVEETRPATLEDLVRRFSQRPPAPPQEPAETKESRRAREEQRRMMERLRRRP